jgi:hypothetical protein
MTQSVSFARRAGAALVALTCLACHVDFARAAPGMGNHVQEVAPRIIERGTAAEVTIRGICLDGAEEIVFYKPGIRAEAIGKTVRIPPRMTAGNSRIEEQITCRLVVAANAPLGEHPFRIRTTREITTVGTIHVGPYATIDETETPATKNVNDTPDRAQDVPVNVTVRGQIDSGPAGDTDVYRVPVTAGERLAVEVACARLTDVTYGSMGHDLALRILDADNRVLAANDNNPLQVQDPLAAMRVERDGFLFVEVHRLIEPWRRDYCVHIGTHARPLVAYPCGGPAGRPLSVTLLGDPLGPTPETILLPAAPGIVEHFGEAPSPIRLRAFDGPNVLEAADGTPVTIDSLPAAANGVIDTRDDSDVFRLRVRKGDRLRLRVYAATLGSPLDPVLRVYPVDKDGTRGPVELSADDATLVDRDIFGIKSRGGLPDILDPSVVWEPQRDGLYDIEISDGSASAAPLGVYRVECEPAPNAIHTALESTGFHWAEVIKTSGMAVPVGNRWTVNISLPPGQGNAFNGPLEIFATGLPEGVRCVSPQLPTRFSPWPVQFVADTAAARGAAVISLGVRPKDGRTSLVTSSQQNVPFANLSGGDAWHPVRLDRYVVAVTHPAAFSVTLDPPRVPVVRGAELTLPVKIVRQPGFTGLLEVGCDYRPPGIGLSPPMTVQAGESTAMLKLNIADSAGPGPWPIVAVASDVPDHSDANTGVGRVRVSSEIVELAVKPPFVTLASEPASIRRGERLRYEWTVRHETAFEGEAEVTLEGLPKGVVLRTPYPRIISTSTAVAFELEASTEALLGPITGIRGVIALTAAGQTITQRSGQGTLRIDPAR